MIVFVLFVFAFLKDIEDYQQDIDEIINYSLKTDGHPWETLSFMTDFYGHRILGSPELQDVSDWLENEMKSFGLTNVQQELVPDVPYWKRGMEKLTMIEPSHRNLKVLGLGKSIQGDITGEVIVVKDKNELDELGFAVEGKIVLFNFDYTSYGSSVQYRTNGALWASKYNALGVLIRSVTPYGIYTTHTGMQNDNPIMSACVTIEDSNMIERLQKRGIKVKVKLKMESVLTNSNSTNIMGEFVGSKYPNEIVVLGDDGCGVITCLEAVRVLIALKKRPKRTIRVVAWAGEEFGGKGGEIYAKNRESEIPNHVLAFESDMGCFEPYGMEFSGSKESEAIVERILSLQKSINTTTRVNGGGGLDVAPLTRAGVPGSSPLTHNDDYFFYHHSEGDRMDVLDSDHLDKGVASIASFIYVVADMDERL